MCTPGVTRFHRGDTTHSRAGAALRSLASVTALAGGDVKTYAHTATMTSDMLTLATSAGDPGAAMLKFSFATDGPLTNDFLSSDRSSLDTPGGHAPATCTRAELSMVSTPDLDHHVLHLASQSVRNGRHPLTFLQENVLDDLRFDQTCDNSDVFTSIDVEHTAELAPVELFIADSTPASARGSCPRRLASTTRS